jgi:hypothetical protein
MHIILIHIVTFLVIGFFVEKEINSHISLYYLSANLFAFKSSVFFCIGKSVLAICSHLIQTFHTKCVTNEIVRPPSLSLSLLLTGLLLH